MKDQVDLAREIATKAHEGQFRWDGVTPYIKHPAAVANAVFQNWLSVYTPNGKLAVAAAWLHDVIEDTPVTVQDLLALGVDQQVINAVKLLTKNDNDSYLDYLLDLKDDEIARMVKIEDIKNNMSDLDKKKKKSMYEKYQLAIYILEGG